MAKPEEWNKGKKRYLQKTFRNKEEDQQLVDTSSLLAARMKNLITSGFSAGVRVGGPIPAADECDPVSSDYEKVVKAQRAEQQRSRDLERQRNRRKGKEA